MWEETVKEHGKKVKRAEQMGNMWEKTCKHMGHMVEIYGHMTKIVGKPWKNWGAFG